MTVRHFIMATAGHVDHGKSALVKTLTGIDPMLLDMSTATVAGGKVYAVDISEPLIRYIEGQAREAGQRQVSTVKASQDSTGLPAGSIDLALFVVAADDGWMPQTEEHLQILSYLGVSRAVVALTKVDLVESDEMIAARLREKLAHSPFAEAPIVPTSVLNARGLAELKATLVRVLSDTPPPRDIGKPRLPVDRVFTLRGIGTVVTGTLTGGTLHRGQPVIVQPSGKTTRIRAVQNHNRDVDVSVPGTRTALNLPDVDADAVQRGDVVTLALMVLAFFAAFRVLSPDLKLPSRMRLKESRRVPLWNGPIECRLFRFDMVKGSARAPAGA